MYKGESEVLNSLKSGKKRIEDISAETGLNVDTVRRAVESLKEKQFVEVIIEETVSFTPSEEFSSYVRKGEMPEFGVFKKALTNPALSEFSEEEKRVELRWAKVKGMVDILNGKVVQKMMPAHANLQNSHLLSATRNISALDAAAREELLKRNLLKKQSSKSYLVALGKKDPSLLDSEDESFDVTVESKDAPFGKVHPLSRLTRKIKDIFGEMGFEEMDGSIIETSFWNFDSLFQPQDHPARELADTFYLERKGELPEDRKMVERVKKSHEQGWKYKWSEEEAKKLVLRTHTTALSTRYLSRLKPGQTPKKYFAVGRVFRNETTDFKHLAEFHQVEGIVAWEGATFKDLLGILKEFYKKLGFEKIRFVPSYFPYTEPSLQVEVFFEPRKQWLELGGAGIFRPEVSKPICGVYPVLAWGLSLERPLMLLMGLEDIRTFYKNDLEWLKGARL
ncbi:MAG: phenylalanine--tRNA ligase subunit alpha [Candidatus Micrarchaeia archaeon]